jgi:hypothetical protein
MVIISPFEANELLPAIKQSKYVTLHVYSPLLTPSLRRLDTLDLYTVPQSSPLNIPRYWTVSLNIFAGQLYVTSFEEFQELYRFFSVVNRQPIDRVDQKSFVLWPFEDGESKTVDWTIVCEFCQGAHDEAQEGLREY